MNPYSRERVDNPTVLRDKDNKVRLVLDQKGVPNIDTWGGSMGASCKGFLKTYATELVKQTAMMSGKTVVEKGVDSQGNLVLEISY